MTKRRQSTLTDHTPREKRHLVCATCRTALCSNQTCDISAEHRVFDLSRRGQRRAFIDLVWSDIAQRRLEALAEPTFEDILSDDSADALDLGKWAYRAVKRRFGSVKPRGVSQAIGNPGRGRVLIGTARRRDAVQLAPLSGRRCLVFGTVFTHLTSFWRSSVILRDAVAIDFDVELNDGSTVRIPTGRVRLYMRSSQPVRPTARALRDYLSELDPLAQATDRLTPFPFQRIGELLIRPGQRIAIAGAFEPRPAPLALNASTSYRNAPPTVQVATGIPTLRLLGSSPRPLTRSSPPPSPE